MTLREAAALSGGGGARRAWTPSWRRRTSWALAGEGRKTRTSLHSRVVAKIHRPFFLA